MSEKTNETGPETALIAGTPDTDVPSTDHAFETAPITVFCKKCGREVVSNPKNPGQCPACGAWVKFNLAALKDAASLRSKQVIAEAEPYRVEVSERLCNERGGRANLDVLTQMAIESIALLARNKRIVEKHLEAEGPFTPTGKIRRQHFDLLKQITESIERQQAALPPITVDPMRGITDAPDFALARGRDLWTRLANKETPNEYDRGQIDLLRQVFSGQLALGAPPMVTRDPVAREPVPVEETPLAPAPAQPGDDPGCPYCHRPWDVCTTMRTSRPDVWPALHFDHPDEIERRRAEATAVMYHTRGTTSPLL